MDDNRFDRLTQAFSESLSRRSAGKVVASLLALSLGSITAGDAKKKKGGKKKKKKTACTPTCTGKECGPNGCPGGTCGTCPQGETCNRQGQCVAGCTPDCAGRSCGDDGCGGNCGVCTQGQTCNAQGKCVRCIPDCDDKACGPDGCGGHCGTCRPDETCSLGGFCECERPCPLVCCPAPQVCNGATEECCTPEPDAVFCQGECGVRWNNCDRPVDCGFGCGYERVKTWSSWGLDGHAPLLQLRGIEADHFGNVYVTANDGANFLQFDSDGNFIALWGTFGTIQSPKGLAVDSDESVYVADLDKILKFDRDGEFLRNWSSGTEAWWLGDPQDVVVDSVGNLYVSGGNQILKLDRDGNLLTRWGQGGSGNGEFSDQAGLALDGQGRLFVADTSNNRIQIFDTNGDFQGKWGTEGSGDGQFSIPRDVAVDGEGIVYVLDSGNERIQTFDSAGRFIEKWSVGTHGIAIALGGDGILYVEDPNNHRILRFDRRGSALGDWDAPSAEGGQAWPSSVTVDGAGNVYVGDALDGIWKLDSHGGVLAHWSPRTDWDGQFQPGRAAVDRDGNVYIGDVLNHRIQKFDRNQKFLGKWGSLGTGDGQFHTPGAIAVDAGGHVYVEDSWDVVRIQKFDAAGEFLHTWVLVDGTYSAIDIAVDPTGNVYVAESYYEDGYKVRIRVYDNLGNILETWEVADGNGDLTLQVSAIAIDDGGNVFVAYHRDRLVRKLDSTGAFTAVLRIDKFPTGVALDGDGTVYISERPGSSSLAGSVARYEPVGARRVARERARRPGSAAHDAQKRQGPKEKARKADSHGRHPSGRNGNRGRGKRPAANRKRAEDHQRRGAA